jgi:uncharacterized membrane protein YraQ (UPF0718 family)
VDYEQLILDFTSIIYEALPFIVLGVMLAGLLEEFVPQQFMARILPRSRMLGIAMGAMLGSIFPMCECGIIVVMRRLLRKGLPLSVCVSYMLAGPILNVIVLLSTYVAFDTPDPRFWIFGGPLNVVLIRGGLAFLVAFVTACVVEWQHRKHGDRLLSPTVLDRRAVVEETSNGGRRSWWDRLNNITGTALNDFVDIMAFLVIGAMLAAIGKAILRDVDPSESVLSQQPAIAILIMMGLAIVFCLCSEADAFVAANFPALWPPASKLAFLVLGPMLDIKLLLMYTRVFRPRLIVTIVTCVIIQVFVLCLVVHYVYQAMGLTGLPTR